MDTQQLRIQLVEQSTALGLTLTDSQLDKLMAYLVLLLKWNNAYNLTAVREPTDMVSRHLIDSLSILPYVHGPRLIDVGSGPGLPGIVLAICRPDLQVTTLDSNGKKTRFQQQVKLELALTNLTVINGRAEQCQAAPFDEVISRAFASISDMIQWCAHLCRPEGVFLAMKGNYPANELTALPGDFEQQHCYQLTVPGTEGERHLLVLGRTTRG